MTCVRRRGATQLTDNGLEVVYGGYPNDGRLFWPDWDCTDHNVTVVLQSQRTNTSRLQGWVTMVSPPAVVPRDMCM